MIRHIVAIDQANGLAKNGSMPWNIPEDEHYFTDQTKLHGGIILTGMGTYRTFKEPLKDRTNYVLTHHTEPIPGATIVHNLDTFLTEVAGDIWIIGGAEVFKQTLNRADELYITRIEATFGCDRFYPEFNDNFTLASQSENKSQNGFNFRYEIYRRNP
ncbi:MAG: dihydrofolate reductase [Candidatus Saccharimonadales bacterium]